MLAKLVICAWSLYLGVDVDTAKQLVGNMDLKGRFTAVQDQVVGAWGTLEESANEVTQASFEEGVKIRLVAIERSVVAATNANRAEYGLPPLEVDEDLMRSARRHCAWMTNNESMRHTSDPVAENIAMGQDSPESVLRTWMGSSGHRANILNGAFRRIGVAAYQTPRGVIFWCQQFQHK